VVEGREQDLKHFNKYVGMKHSNNETQEGEKEWRELNFSKLAIARYHAGKINNSQECLDK
jgi:hypothetical protein